MITLQFDRLPSELLCTPHTAEKMGSVMHILTHSYHTKKFPMCDVELLEALMERVLNREPEDDNVDDGDHWEALLNLRVSNMKEVPHVPK